MAATPSILMRLMMDPPRPLTDMPILTEREFQKRSTVDLSAFQREVSQGGNELVMHKLQKMRSGDLYPDLSSARTLTEINRLGADANFTHMIYASRNPADRTELAAKIIEFFRRCGDMILDFSPHALLLIDLSGPIYHVIDLRDWTEENRRFFIRYVQEKVQAPNSEATAVVHLCDNPECGNPGCKRA